MIRMTLDCVIPTQSSVIQTIHCNVGLKFFFNFTKVFVIIVMYAYFIDISHSNVETYLQCDGCRSMIGKDMDKSRVACFLAHPVL